MGRILQSAIEFEGTVLRAFPYSDSDLILKVLSPTKGKISLIARHARQSKKKFSSSFDTFDTGTFRVKIHGSQKQDSLGNILEFLPRRSFAELRTDLDRLVIASVLCESFDALIPEFSPDSCDCYGLLELGLQAISSSEEPKSALKACFLSLANLLKREGILGDAPLIPTSKNLLHVLKIISNNVNRELNTIASLKEILGRL
ncbi:MAG: DNA repair protein RecO [bacterium]|nr:DNA repair protein RecO [bacterium]